MADVESVIHERLAEIDSERRRLDAALAELTSRPPARRRRKSDPGRSKASGARRAKPGERSRQVLAYLEENPGARASEIATAIKASANQVYAVIAKLRKDKLVRKRGKGFGLVAAAESSTSAKRTRPSRRSGKSASSEPPRRSGKT